VVDEAHTDSGTRLFSLHRGPGRPAEPTLADLQAQMGQLQAQVTALARTLEDMVVPTASPTGDMSLDDHLDDVAAAVRAGTDRLVRRMEEERAGLADEVTARVVDQITDGVRARVDALAGHLQEIRDPRQATEAAVDALRTTLTAAMAAQANRVEALTSGVTQQLADQVAALGTELRDVSATAVRELRESSMSTLQGLQEQVERTEVAARAFEEAADGNLDQIRADATALADTLRREVAEVQDGMAALTRHLDDALERVAATVSGQQEQFDVVVATLREDLSSEVVGLAERVRRNLQELLREFSEEAHQAVGKLGERAEASATSAASSLADAVTAAAGRIHVVTDSLDTRLDQMERRLGEAAASVDAVEQSLAQQLDEQRRQVVIERAVLTQAFVEQLAGSLTRRERKRLAQRLDPTALAGAVVDVDRATSPPPGGLHVSVPEGTLRTTSLGTRPRSTPRPVSPPRSAEAPTAAEGLGDIEALDLAATPEDPPSWERPARRRVVRAPDHLRVILEPVRGLGEQRRELLVERFGSVAALRDADDDDVLEVRGVGPALLAAIRQAIDEDALDA
jgi:hypothetical protein